MPAAVKTVLSLVALATAACAYYFLSQAGKTESSFAVAFLGIFATAAMWVFPEVMRKSPTSMK
jgi:hypothetical protein